MAFYDVSLLAKDAAFLDRCAACYAIETPIEDITSVNPAFWATMRQWDLASAPGFGEAYTYAINNGNPNPGSDPAVITDDQILSAVQAIMAAEEAAQPDPNPEA